MHEGESALLVFIYGVLVFLFEIGVSRYRVKQALKFFYIFMIFVISRMGINLCGLFLPKN